MKKKIFSITMVLIFFISSTAFSSEFKSEVHFIDAGQSDCILIKSKFANYLLDTGAEYYTDKIINYLSINNITKIEAIIITHFHDDHYGGLIKICEKLQVDKVYLPLHNNEIKYSLYKSLIDRGINVKYINTNFALDSKGIHLKAIGPLNEDRKNENNNSIVLQGEIDGVKYLFPGDCEKEEEIDLIKSKLVKKCDVLKVPHHSLNTSSTDRFLEVIKPEIAIVTCNGVETPDLKVLTKYVKYGASVLRTDIHGNIVVKNDMVKRSKNELLIKLTKQE